MPTAHDLSMLDGSCAKMTACPANAIDPVKQLVRRSQGYIADKCWADGVAEALDFYENITRGWNFPAHLPAEAGTTRPV